MCREVLGVAVWIVGWRSEHGWQRERSEPVFDVIMTLPGTGQVSVEERHYGTWLGNGVLCWKRRRTLEGSWMSLIAVPQSETHSTVLSISVGPYAIGPRSASPHRPGIISARQHPTARNCIVALTILDDPALTYWLDPVGGCF